MIGDQPLNKFWDKKDFLEGGGGKILENIKTCKKTFPKPSHKAAFVFYALNKVKYMQRI